MLNRALTVILITVLMAGGLELPAHAASGTLMPEVKRTFVDNNGDPCSASCRVFWFVSGTTTKLSAYSDVGLTSALANPTTLDTSGRIAAGGPFLTPGLSYKVVLAPAGSDDPPSSPIWTQDNVAAVPPAGSSADTDVTGTAGEALSAGDAVAMSDGSGGGTAGRWYKADSDLTYLSISAQTVGFATTAISAGSSGTIRRGGRITGLTGLTAGTLYFISATGGALTSTAPTNARAILQADSTTAGVILTGEPYASSTLQGVVSTGTQTLAGAKTFSSAITATGGVTWPSTATTLNYAYSRTTSNFTKNNNTSHADVTGLSFAIGASETWVFRAVMFQVSATAADWQVAVTGPAAPAGVRLAMHSSMDTPSAASVAAFSSSMAVAGSAVDDVMVLDGIVRNGVNAGTIQVTAAQLAANVSNSVIYTDSYITAWRVQ